MCFPYLTQQKIKAHQLYCLLTIQLARKKAYIHDQEDPNYHLTCKHDHHIGIHKVLTVAYERFRDICHDARVHLWKSFCFVNSHIKSGPWSFRWKSFGDQEIPERRENTSLKLKVMFFFQNCYLKLACILRINKKRGYKFVFGSPEPQHFLVTMRK